MDKINTLIWFLIILQAMKQRRRYPRDINGEKSKYC